jgi:hypothetical protein
MPPANIKPSRVALFSKEKCESLCERIQERRDDWISRGNGGFFTLGRAAYLDAPNRVSAYRNDAESCNATLLAAFPEVYEQLCLALSQELGTSVGFAPGYAVPGFHIFLLNGTDRSRDNIALRSHYDLQWRHVVPKADGCAHLTFTALIEQPTGGASMAVWDLRHGEPFAPFPSAIAYAEAHPPVIINYRAGELVLHDGLNLHAIGKSSETAPIGIRITLQGHGFLQSDGTWVLYW